MMNRQNNLSFQCTKQFRLSHGSKHCIGPMNVDFLKGTRFIFKKKKNFKRTPLISHTNLYANFFIDNSYMYLNFTYNVSANIVVVCSCCKSIFPNQRNCNNNYNIPLLYKAINSLWQLHGFSVSMCISQYVVSSTQLQQTAVDIRRQLTFLKQRVGLHDLKKNNNRFCDSPPRVDQSCTSS